MKLIAILLLCALALVAGPLCWGAAERRREAEALNVARLVECLRQMEGGKSGSLGGEWCISRAVWHDRTQGAPYMGSTIPDACHKVATEQVKWIIACLEISKIKPTPALIGQCWRFGLESYLLTRKTGDYGQRLANLYNDAPSR